MDKLVAATAKFNFWFRLWKQSLYLHEIVARSANTLISPRPHLWGFTRHSMMSEIMQASQFHQGNFHGQPSQGCRQWETGNYGISQFVLSTESKWGPCICPTKDEQRSAKLGKLPSSLVR